MTSGTRYHLTIAALATMRPVLLLRVLKKAVVHELKEACRLPMRVQEQQAQQLLRMRPAVPTTTEPLFLFP